MFKLILFAIFFTSAWARYAPVDQSDLERLKDLISSYESSEVVTAVGDEYLVSEHYGLDWKFNYPCDIVIRHYQDYQYSYNFNNDRNVLTTYYIDLKGLDVTPIEESVATDASDVIPFKKAEGTFNAYVQISYTSGETSKKYSSNRLVLVKFTDNSERIEFGKLLIDTIKTCRLVRSSI